MTDLYGLYRGCGCKVTTDSRSISGGEIFFALKGENFDGNNYAMAALQAGAAYAVVDECAGLPDAPGLVKVADTFEALKNLAIEHRCTLAEESSLKVLGLTGTNGKTTTKELIAAVLATTLRITATKGNLNNDIGVPLSLLSITPDTQVAVIEMGANHPDDIAKLVKVSRPDMGLITNVGKAHLLGFGSFEGVKAAKGELYKWLGGVPHGTVFLNEDDENLRGMLSGIPVHIFGYGLNYQGAELLPQNAEHPFLRLKVGGRVISTKLVGAYNATNVLAAICVGEYFGVPFEAAVKAIEAYTPANSRSQMTRTERNTLFLDAYNANPSSMAAALSNFTLSEAPLKIALLGDMRELGEDSVGEHIKVLEILRSSGLNAYLVGEEFGKAIAETGGDCVLGWFRTSSELAAHLQSHPVEGALILVKGSRGIQMEKTIPAL